MAAPMCETQDVSVIMPARNVAATVERSVRSVLAEPEVLELIVVDDASDDDTPQILERLRAEDPRLVVIKGGNLGVTKGVNRGLEEARGALVTDVPDGPASEAGVEAGDVILSFDGNEIEDTRDLVRRVGDSTVGASARMVVFRDGKTQTLKVVLGRRETAENAVPAVATAEAEPEVAEVMGLSLSSITSELREELDLGENASGLVVVDVDGDSEAYEKGLRAGDLITEAGQQKVADVTAFGERIKAAKEGGRKSILLLVRRAGEPRFVALSLDDE